MSSIFQSETMTLCQLFLQSEAAYACVNELGELGLAQFRDLNPEANAFQRKFVNEVRRCDEMERKLRYLEKEMKKDEIPMADDGDNPETPQPREMIDLEAMFEKLESELREVTQNAEALKRNFLDMTELLHILNKTQIFFDEREGEVSAANQIVARRSIADEPFSGRIVQGAGHAQLAFVAGVILREKLAGFERMLWRACRGNVFLRHAEIDAPLEDPSTGDQVQKIVFIIFFQGDQLKSRVRKICEGFRATLYPCPETQAERREMSLGVMTRIQDLNTVLSQTQDHRHRVLLAAAKSMKTWFIKVRKIKAIYHTLNLFNLDVTQKCLIGEAWVPVEDLKNIQDALRRGTDRAGSAVPPILNRMESKENPPTFNRLNKFTRGFQNLVDAYGIASYREVNPTPYTVITFPFLFAVMFGDAGHAMIMFGFALWMVLKEKSLIAAKIKSEIWTIFFGGRYILLLMGLFSFYTGIVYNDIFSKSMNIFGSRWNVNITSSIVWGGDINQKQPEGVQNVMLDPVTCYEDSPYFIGVDPAWQLAVNKISFLNAYKMKISIIIGVCHMLFGVMLSLWNHVYFKRALDIFCEFIPQIIFMLFLFMYLNILVFYKWIFYWAKGGVAWGPHCAPSILITFINMVLFKGGEPSDFDCDAYMFPKQQLLQQILVVTAVLCVPWMLLIKPFVLKSRHGNKAKSKPKGSAGESDVESALVNGGHASVDGSGGGHGHEEEFDFAEEFIHQAIHTIEYVLGSVSHTASYLRLWALSLAHAQLSEVLWSMVMHIGLAQTQWWGSFILFAIFAFWAACTVSILILMEGLSAFLHTLRLHWVEFQSKFYKGEGYLFTPFSFRQMIEDAEEAEED